MSIHINAKKNEIARIVILSSDPKRMEFMAYKFLTNVKQVSNLRNQNFFTGEYKGKKVTFGSHGMGQYAAGTIATELIVEYGVDVLIRCGSASSYISDINLLDTIIINRAYSDNLAVSRLVNNELSHVYYPNKILTESLEESAKQLKIPYRLESIHSADVYYSNRSISETIDETNSTVVDGESFAIFAVAKRYDKKAAAVLQISDNLPNMEYIDSLAREQGIIKNFEIVLETISNNKTL
ncbi:purine nucleoside phosphorylase DeoD-type [Mycoplasmopsis felifaucium]|uniref:Uridine phosphorylase n=1 Tax=Mycoplasmopsis felifaucium TaxID=35768 RepID=A0ABZ2RTM7_9BACT